MTIKNRIIFYSLLSGLFLISAACVQAQTDGENFRKVQQASPRVAAAQKKYTDSLKKYFDRKNLQYPSHDIYLRVFKNMNDLEIWARNDNKSEYRLVKTMHICASSGVLGPKRQKGDRQVPEGFYFINEFNTTSEYFLSLQVSYPNYSDSLLGNTTDLGGGVYFHGGCLTIGCMPMTNEGIMELYTLCLSAYMEGQEFIPVHIFPARLNRNGMSYLNREYGYDKAKQEFWAGLKASFDYFEKYHKLLPVMYTPDGKYTY